MEGTCPRLRSSIWDKLTNLDKRSFPLVVLSATDTEIGHQMEGSHEGARLSNRKTNPTNQYGQDE